MDYRIPDSIMSVIEREIDFDMAVDEMKATREKDKSNTRADIIDTAVAIISDIDNVKSLGMLQRIQKDLHNLEDEIHLITGHMDEDHKPGSYWNGEKWVTAGNYKGREESRYGEW